ncbi:MAG: ATP-binding cassette domain-containing protein [Candidatus Marinimicrobia bacterium]|nr:ATP-binding cassette domain-containing protein [Candidatus Neomarinimicrobiota bacterium]
MPKSLFEIKNLKYKRGGQNQLSISNFEIHRGIAYAITGQPGSGKTTFLELLAGRLKPQQGTLTFDGYERGSAEFRTKYNEEVYYLAQAPVRAWGKVSKYMSRNIRLAAWSTDSIDTRLKSISKLFSLGDKLDRKIRALSPGERRWIDMAVALASDAKVLIIDELEQHTSFDELDLVKRQLQRKCNYEGITVILSTLNPGTIRRLSGVSVTLDRGRIAMIRSVRDGGRTRKPQSGGVSNRGSGQTGRKRSGRSSARQSPPTKSTRRTNNGNSK